MLIAGVVAGIVLIVVWAVGRPVRFRPSFEAACEVTVGGRRLVAYSGHRKVNRLANPATHEDTALLTDSRTWIRTLCEVDVDCRPLLASSGRHGVVRLWDLENRGARVASLTGHRGWVYRLCTVRSRGATCWPRRAGTARYASGTRATAGWCARSTPAPGGGGPSPCVRCRRAGERCSRPGTATAQ